MRLVFLYKGNCLDICKPILNLVSPHSVIVVGKKCIMLVKWNGKEKSIEYISSTPNRSLIETAMNVFNINIPIEQVSMSSLDGKELNPDQTIPFDGYEDSIFTFDTYDSIDLTKKQDEHCKDVLIEQKKNETNLNNIELECNVRKQKNIETSIVKNHVSMIAYDCEALCISQLLSLKHRNYCQNLLQQEGLTLSEEWMSVFTKKENGKHRQLDYNLKTKEIKFSQDEGDGSPFIAVDLSCIKYDSVIDVSTDGLRWEGTSLHCVPFGYGSLYNSYNELVYRGVMIGDRKECFGIDFFPGLDVPQYCGCYWNNRRHGYGMLYDRKGDLVYEGGFLSGLTDYETSVVLKNWSRDSQLIHCFTRELVFDKKYKAEEKDDVRICGLDCLDSLVLNCSLKNLGTLTISDNPVLRLFAARDINEYITYPPFHIHENSILFCIEFILEDKSFGKKTSLHLSSSLIDD